MDIGLLLLLILALAIGWFLGYRSSASQKLSSVQSFLKNWGFSTQTHSSIEQIQSLIKLDNEGFETYLGLGNTYRKRGDTPKAVELHQFLQQSEALSPEQKHIAQLEEALDYQAAGFFDKSEDVLLNLLSKLNQQSLIKNKVLKSLVSVYARQKNWSKASETAQMVGGFDERYKRIAAHIVAEDIEAQLNTGSAPADLKKQLSEIINLHERSPRLALLRVKLAETEEELAQQSQQSIIDHPQTASEVFQAINKFCQDADAMKNYLTELLPTWDKPELFNLCLAISPRDQTLGQAVLDGLNHDDLVQQALEQSTHYICQRCGFQTSVFAWQCPQCKSWGHLDLNNSYKA